MNELALFAGGGGGLLGSLLLGWKTVCYVEREPYCIEIIKQRIADGILHDAPIWDDVRTFDGKPWRGCVDIVTAGWPCNDISSNNQYKRGLDGEHSGLFTEVCRIVHQVGPRCVFLENVSDLLVRGMGEVLEKLAAIGFGNVRWECFPAAAVGNPQRRWRVWLVAYPNDVRFQGGDKWLEERQNASERCEHDGLGEAERRAEEGARSIRGMANVGSRWVDRLRALGNAQVPAVVVHAWRELSAEFGQQ